MHCSKNRRDRKSLQSHVYRVYDVMHDTADICWNNQAW